MSSRQDDTKATVQLQTSLLVSAVRKCTHGLGSGPRKQLHELDLGVGLS